MARAKHTWWGEAKKERGGDQIQWSYHHLSHGLAEHFCLAGPVELDLICNVFHQGGTRAEKALALDEASQIFLSLRSQGDGYLLSIALFGGCTRRGLKRWIAYLKHEGRKRAEPTVDYLVLTAIISSMKTSLSYG